MRRLTIPSPIPAAITVPGGEVDAARAELAAVAAAVADEGTSPDELAGLLARAVELAGGTGIGALVLDAEPVPADLDQAAASAGFALVRTLHQLRRPLPISPELRPPEPSGPRPTFRSYVPGADDDAWLAVNNRAFAWHPEQSGWTRDDLAGRRAEPWFRADGFLVHDGEDGAIDGFCWTKIHRDEDPPVGEIYVIAVDPRRHGRGLGRALALAGLDWLTAQGITMGMLYVEADNDAAMALYHHLGFVSHQTHRWWRREVV